MLFPFQNTWSVPPFWGTTLASDFRFQVCQLRVPLLLVQPLGIRLTRSASLVSQALRSSGGGSSLPHNTFCDTTFPTLCQMCSSESHVIPISKMTFKATTNDFRTLQKICIFTDNLFSFLPLHLHLASSNRMQYSYL